MLSTKQRGPLTKGKPYEEESRIKHLVKHNSRASRADTILLRGCSGSNWARIWYKTKKIKIVWLIQTADFSII